MMTHRDEMDERQRRIGKNEALFRQLNDKVETLNESFATLSEEFVIVCECGDGACLERIAMEGAEYEQLRSNPTHFAVVSGHVAADVERVVSRRERYWVIEKLEGEPARLARQLDERMNQG